MKKSNSAHFLTPEELLGTLGIREPQDIHLEAIAQYCGATILYERLKGSDARILGLGEKAFITVNSEVTPARQRFSAAHELGHWMWDRGSAAYACGREALTPPLTQGSVNPERRANQYAVGLILPREMFLKSIAGQTMDFDSVADVADRYRTSLSATAIRWVELTTGLVVLSGQSGEGRRWTMKSANVPNDWQRRRFHVTEEILARGADASLTLTTLH